MLSPAQQTLAARAKQGDASPNTPVPPTPTRPRLFPTPPKELDGIRQQLDEYLQPPIDLQAILPVKGVRNVLITSALPYVNNVPHLGNIIGSVLSADVYSRWCKARGYQTLFVCGSDEYGTATETKALEEGLTPQQLCDKYHRIHKEIYDWFNIGFDVFGRTPTEHQTRITQDIFKKLWGNGFILEREEFQPFCSHPDHNKFLADRFVEGECSICHDQGARGDQCDKCGRVLDPFQPELDVASSDSTTDNATGWLINPRCKVHGTPPERRKTRHLYLRLDKLQHNLEAWFASLKEERLWSANGIQITESAFQKGLLPRPITRDLKWGTKIPQGMEGLSDEYADKAFYVWFDACIGYVSITASHTDPKDADGKLWEKWWKNDDVELVQFMGKDNVWFHSLMFPGSQIGTGDHWTKAHKLSVTEYLNYEESKFSKSKGVGVFGNNAKDTGIKPDIWRYYLLSRRPETADSEFKWTEFVDANNNDLLKNLGNFNQRVLKFCQAKYDSVVPDYTKYTSEGIDAHVRDVNALLNEYNTHMDATKLRLGLHMVLSISALGNKILQDNKLDNRLLTEEPDRCAAVIGLAVNHIALLASIVAPYMPGTAANIFEQLALEPRASIPDAWATDAIKPGHKLGTPKLLFTQIPAAKVDEWRDAYGGEEVKKTKELAARKAEEKRLAKVRAKERDNEKKRLKKLAAAKNKENARPAAKPSVETIEKKETADPDIEKVTEAIAKANVHTS
ncbi:methionyl-tRNA synthetase [Diaporthe helianthi]|uniref:methionine--tRNA ligase n=1 Tax=Diaporthe helianthi TaxID=158607 RepID=A0A2P5I8Z6_DIAHE|nr:methionyl-tRNA synthetase [Diaporthe helianthi]